MGVLVSDLVAFRGVDVATASGCAGSGFVSGIVGLDGAAGVGFAVSTTAGCDVVVFETAGASAFFADFAVVFAACNVPVALTSSNILLVSGVIGTTGSASAAAFAAFGASFFAAAVLVVRVVVFFSFASFTVSFSTFSTFSTFSFPAATFALALFVAGFLTVSATGPASSATTFLGRPRFLGGGGSTSALDGIAESIGTQRAWFWREDVLEW